MTALLDAQGRTIVELGQELNHLPASERPGKVIVMTMTDGMENASQLYTDVQVAAMVEHQREVYKWQFLYLGANQDAIRVAAGIGIPRRRDHLLRKQARRGEHPASVRVQHNGRPVQSPTFVRDIVQP